LSKLTDDILSSIDIVDVISRHVSLKRAWSNYSGCCPFHNEKTPSFMVSPQKQIFKCFWCGKWGNVFTFLQEYERIDFWDAVKLLAKDANIDIANYEIDTKKLDQYADEKEKIKRIHKLAQRFFIDWLKKSKEAKDYLHEKRKLDDTTIEHFGVWFAPDSSYDLWNFLKSKWFSDNDLIQASLIKPSKNSDFYTFFKKRITFPIYDTMNNIIGFSARVLDPNDNPKYLNSSEHPAFEKSKILYWLNWAKQNISQFGFLIVVEWQMDVIALHRLGFPVAVATSGTSLTEDHIKILKRYTDTVYFLFDSDQAGQNATQRALSLTYQQDLFPKQLILPPEFKDADDLANSPSGKEHFAQILENAEDGFSAVFSYIKTQYDIKSPIDKQKILNILFGLIQKINNISLQQHYIQVISDTLSSPFEFTRSQYKQFTQNEGKIHTRQKIQKTNLYKPSRELLFASLFYNNFFEQHQETPTIWSTLIALKEFFLILENNPLTPFLDSKDEETIESLNQHQLRWEKEFELKTEEKKIQLIKQTLGQTIKSFLQQALKNPHISHEQKQQLLKLNKDFSK